MGQPASFCSFHTQILQKKTASFSRIRTRGIGVEGEHADHMNTITARKILKINPEMFYSSINVNLEVAYKVISNWNNVL